MTHTPNEYKGYHGIVATEERIADATNGGFPPDVPTKVHGRNAAEITAEVIKKNGLDVAQEIRELAKRAREEGEAMAQYAEQVADSIIESSSQAAARISGYIDRCTAARASVEDHKNTLADLPTPEAVPTYADPRNAAQYAAVEKALGKLMLQDK